MRDAVLRMSLWKPIFCVDDSQLGENIVFVAFLWTAIAMVGRIDNFPASMTNMTYLKYIIHEAFFFCLEKKGRCIIVLEIEYLLLNNTSNRGLSSVGIFATLSVDLDAAAVRMRIVVATRNKLFKVYDHLAASANIDNGASRVSIDALSFKRFFVF